VPAELLREGEGDSTAHRWNIRGKPANVLEKIIEGKLGSFLQADRAADQDSIRDTTGRRAVKDVLAAANKGLGASVSVTRFARLKVGEAAQ